MPKLKKWIGIFVCVAAWAWLYGFFLRLEKTVEPQMFANGHQGRWWAIVQLYWIADTVILLCLALDCKKAFWSLLHQRQTGKTGSLRHYRITEGMKMTNQQAEGKL
jgi:hypothetical protein